MRFCMPSPQSISAKPPGVLSTEPETERPWAKRALDVPSTCNSNTDLPLDSTERHPLSQVAP